MLELENDPVSEEPEPTAQAVEPLFTAPGGVIPTLADVMYAEYAPVPPG